jgi:uncharacterized OB-fold protein
MTDRTIRLGLSLGYDHGSGALGDYFKALAEGRALAGRCGTCGRTWFPPHARCPEDGGVCEPIDLDGHGVVVAGTRTRTRLPFTDEDREVTFVLVAMAGADNAVFGRLENFSGASATGERVRLVAVAGPLGHPAQGAVFNPAGGG